MITPTVSKNKRGQDNITFFKIASYKSLYFQVNASQQEASIPFEVDIGSTKLCLSVKMVPGNLYTLLDTDNTQIYGEVAKVGTIRTYWFCKIGRIIAPRRKSSKPL